MGRVMCGEYEKQTKHRQYLDTACVLRVCWRVTNTLNVVFGLTCDITCDFLP